tara:strand:- start:248 stop:406 length:159 start_codon:yes stop_codon:yes gene_type:complete
MYISPTTNPTPLSKEPDEVKKRRRSKAIRKGMRNSVIALDDAIERALEKDRF